MYKLRERFHGSTPGVRRLCVSGNEQHECEPNADADTDAHGPAARTYPDAHNSTTDANADTYGRAAHTNTDADTECATASSQTLDETGSVGDQIASAGAGGRSLGGKFTRQRR